MVDMKRGLIWDIFYLDFFSKRIHVQYSSGKPKWEAQMKLIR